MKTYTLEELQEMPISQLTTIADSDKIDIQNCFRDGLVRAISYQQQESKRKPSELHSRDRYNLTQIG